jgi:methanogenic corrinoid protein MtbC1
MPIMSASAEFAAEIIESSAKALAEWTVALQEERSPRLREQLGAGALTDLRADTHVRVLHLANSVAFDEPAILCEHVEWAKACFVARDVPRSILERNMTSLSEVLADRLPDSTLSLVKRPMEAALRTLRAAPRPTESFVEGDGPLMSLARRYVMAILEGDRGPAREMLQQAMDDGTPVADLFEHVVQRAQSEIGRLWQLDEISVAEEHLASASSEWVVAHLVLNAPHGAPKDRTLIATSISGDTHCFGVRLVADSFELDGWRTYFLGASTPLVDLVQAVVDREADLLALSANLGCHLRELKRVIDALRSQPETAGVLVMVGGRPLNLADDLWKKVGADGFARTARQAVAEGNRLVEARDAG